MMHHSRFWMRRLVEVIPCGQPLAQQMINVLCQTNKFDCPDIAFYPEKEALNTLSLCLRRHG
ncbi:hypothetical protein BDP55DRAFT_687575 [Colletotrichum godetiae]|uniref:Uncharacterized protein n=1 Tax=Colletotrichum godetiae TaxID=1209918 RepID=A0AAJ0A5H7_9PEZI|nr:uncharacterized protein BDP55DRAFT_687575 [Colletotrichum godetiae]KAK1656889.1 hypothetical protein BDP55DRAFT_687575 [Colletotrichum godetiae]